MIERAGRLPIEGGVVKQPIPVRNCIARGIRHAAAPSRAVAKRLVFCCVFSAFYAGTASFCFAENLANIWISTSSGSCTRSSTPQAYNAGSACGSYSAAYKVASGGDIIYVKAGTYGSQAVPYRSGMGTSVVTIQQEPGGGNVSIAGGISIQASYVVVDGAYATQDWQIGDNTAADGSGGCNKTPSNGWPCEFRTTHVTLRNFSGYSGYIYGDTVLVQNGNVGPKNICTQGGEDGIQILGLGNAASPSFTPAVNVTIDNVTVHDITNDACQSVHTDGIQGFGYRNLTIKNSRIYNTATSLILAYSQDNTNPAQVDAVLIANNYFGNVAHPGHGVSLGNDPSYGVSCGSSNLKNVIENNTFYGNMGADVNCGGSPDAVFRNNIVLAGEACSYGAHDFQYAYNVFSPTGYGAGCSVTPHAKLCSPSFSDPTHAGGKSDLASNDSCAKDFVGTAVATYPATDIYATLRPQGSAADAGAYEIPSGQTPASPTALTAVSK